MDYIALPKPLIEAVKAAEKEKGDLLRGWLLGLCLDEPGQWTLAADYSQLTKQEAPVATPKP